MIVRDWREADASLLRACYDNEHRSWLADLAWDTGWTWTTIEQARTTWGLPGFVAAGSTGADGWTFYVRDGRTIHVGGLVAANSLVTDALLDAVLAALPAEAERVSCFVRDRAAGLGDTLARRGFDVEPFLYLARPLIPADGGPTASLDPPAAPWQDGDVERVAALLAAAYAPDAARHFAPGGSADAWRQYLRGLVEQAGCGTFDPAATCLLRRGGVRGAALVTSLARETAHLAQLAVRPDDRGGGLGRRLVRDVIQRAARAGKRSLTLLVGESNEEARRLYASLGFTQRGRFLSAHASTVNFCPGVSIPETRSAGGTADLHT